MLRKAVVLNLTPAQGSINPSPKKDSSPEFGSQPRHGMRYFKSLYKFLNGKVKPLLILSTLKTNLSKLFQILSAQ